MIRAILLTLALDALIIMSFASYTAGVVEGVTLHHTHSDIADKAGL